MNITFLIGNGFDLNLGLRTRYIDFYKSYTKEPNKNDPFAEVDSFRQFKKIITKDLSTWADAELAFGKYTKDFYDRGKNAGDFCECHDDFCVELASYLERESKRISTRALTIKAQECFGTAINSFTMGFHELPKTQIISAINQFGGNYTFNFINFNYTDILDKCVETVKSNGDGCLGGRLFQNTKFANSIGELLHVHGTTKENMILAVNDESQISEIKLFDGYDSEYVDSLIKVKANALAEENTDSKVHNLIQNSDLIYIYGMSLGATDKIWWQRIFDAMGRKPHLALIINKRGVVSNALIARQMHTQRNAIIQSFVNNSECDKDTKDYVKKRIFVTGANIFEGLSGFVNSKENTKALKAENVFA